MSGHWDEDGTQFAATIKRVVAKRTDREPSVASLPWWVFTLGAPFNETFREVKELRYLWRTPLRMDNARLVATLGREPRTPLDEAIEATLQGQGCLR